MKESSCSRAQRTRPTLTSTPVTRPCLLTSCPAGTRSSEYTPVAHQLGQYIPVIRYTTTTPCALSVCRGHTVCREGDGYIDIRVQVKGVKQEKGMLLKEMFPGKKFSVSRVTVSVSEEMTSAAASIYPPPIGQSSQIQALR